MENPTLLHCAETTVLSLGVTGRNKESWNSQHAVMFISLAVVDASTDRGFVTSDTLTLAHQRAGWVYVHLFCVSVEHTAQGSGCCPVSSCREALSQHRPPGACPELLSQGFHRNAVEAFGAPSGHLPLENITSKWESLNDHCSFMPRNTEIKGK